MYLSSEELSIKWFLSVSNYSRNKSGMPKLIQVYIDLVDGRITQLSVNHIPWIT